MMRFLQGFGFRDIIWFTLEQISVPTEMCVCVCGSVYSLHAGGRDAVQHNGVQCTQVRSSQSVQLVSTESVSIHTQILIEPAAGPEETHISTLKYCTHTHTHTLKYCSHTHTQHTPHTLKYCSLTHTTHHTEVLFTHSLTTTHTTQYHLCVQSPLLVIRDEKRVDLRHIPLSDIIGCGHAGGRSLKPAAPHQTVRPDTPEEQDTHTSQWQHCDWQQSSSVRCVYLPAWVVSRTIRW